MYSNILLNKILKLNYEETESETSFSKATWFIN